MRSKTRRPRSPARVWLAIPARIFHWIARRVETGDRADTIDRFFHSRHVSDLRAVVVIALGAVLLVFVIGLALSLENAFEKFYATDKPSNINPYLQLAAGTLAGFLTFFAPVVAVFGAVVGWAYQAGSARLGVVDLFACEISTLCRVTTVLDTVSLLIRRLGTETAPAAPGAPAAAPARPALSNGFASQEDYFPVFTNNTKDLQSLEARVVINITAFYTYMKAVRDSMRALAALAGAPACVRHKAGRDLIYLIYLGLESARKAVNDLVEFEPEEAERTISILISELAAYRFLLTEFDDEDNMRYHRLRLRARDYRELVEELCATVEQGKHGPDWRSWERPWTSLPELRKRYAGVVDAAKAPQPPIAVEVVPPMVETAPASAPADLTAIGGADTTLRIGA